MQQPLRIRPEKPADYPEIKRINDLAFGQQNEGVLIEKLRLEPAYIRDLSLVALLRGKPVGHILFFPVNIENGKQGTPSLSLAPMAVDPEFQNQGIGSRLVEYGLQRAGDAGFSSVVVLGHPRFYPRFGFVPASRWGITSPWEVPDDVFMAMALTDGSLDGVSGKVVFSNVFNEAI
ncbi:MAG: N-acetyltransferase [Bacteroidales bacterium]|nr:N-acetyltransferase [Bacteroidales bacterium]